MKQLGFGEHCAKGEQYDEAHEAHIAINAECPWCGAYDPSAQVSDAEADAIIGELTGTPWL